MQYLSSLYFLYLFIFGLHPDCSFSSFLFSKPLTHTHPLFLLCFASVKGRPPMVIYQPWYIKYGCSFLTNIFVIEIYLRVLMEYHIYQGNTHFSILRNISNKAHSQLFRKCLELLFTGFSEAEPRLPTSHQVPLPFSLQIKINLLLFSQWCGSNWSLSY